MSKAELAKRQAETQAEQVYGDYVDYFTCNGDIPGALEQMWKNKAQRERGKL